MNLSNSSSLNSKPPSAFGDLMSVFRGQTLFSASKNIVDCKSMDRHEYPMYVINAFTKAPFSGNPAAVCLVKKNLAISDHMKQKLAAEMNLSETAYVTTLNDEDDFSTASRFGLRWFTPTTEVNLCGHATLASSAVLFNCLGNPNTSITFDTFSGALEVQKTADGKFRLDFPSNKPEAQDTEEVKSLIKIAVGTLPYRDVRYSPATQKLLIRLDDKVTRSQFQSQTPPSNLLLHAHNSQKITGVILTLRGSVDNGCQNEEGTVYDFVSRYFTPWHGIAEDPVTGSAHTVLGPYWAEILGKKKLFACQCSKRSGQLWLDVTKGRVEITGEVFTFLKGSVCVQ